MSRMGGTGVPLCATGSAVSWKHWVAGSIPGPAQWINDPALLQLHFGSDPWPGNSIAMISRMVVIPGVITIPRNLTRWQRRKKWVLFMEAPACYVGESQKWLASILYPLSEVAGRISSEGKIFLMDIASHIALGHPCWWRKTWPELKINSLLIMEKYVYFCVMEYQ